MTLVTLVTPNSMESRVIPHTQDPSLRLQLLSTLYLNPWACMSWTDELQLTYHAEVPPPGGDERSQLPLTWRHSAPNQRPSKMYCFVVTVGRLDLDIAGIPLRARCWFFLNIWCVVKAAGTNKSIQTLEAHQECPQRQTDKTHRAAWTNLQPAQNRDVNKSGKWSK